MSTGERLRADAKALLQAAIAAAIPEPLVAEHLAARTEEGAEMRIAAIGKAAAAMAHGALRALGEGARPGVLIVPENDATTTPPGFEVFRGGHPVPNAASVAGAEAIRRLAESLGADGRLLFLISGGGSALMTLPPAGLTLDHVLTTTRALLHAGATIGELNTVRKHLDELKGGRLARHAAPARVLGLVLSDVVGDPLDTIASGPLSPDPTTFDSAVEILHRRGIWETLPELVRRHLERGAAGEEPESAKPGEACFETTEVVVVGNNRLAAEAALAEAGRRGYRTLLLTTSLTGEAREVGGVLAALAREIRVSGHPLAPPACLVAAGETTVTVRGQGRGGRNQELALGAAFGLEGLEGALVASAGTDGIDGPTDAAGAWADGETLARATACGLDARQALADNDAYGFFEPLRDLILLGPTGTNVMDVQVVLVG